MVYQTSQASKQGDLRNKVTTKSRPVKQVLTLAKAHLGRHRLHRHLSAMGYTAETKALSGCHCVTVIPAAPVTLSASPTAAALCPCHCQTCLQ